MKVFAMILSLLVFGQAVAQEDTREAVILGAAERAIVLKEMRMFLSGLQGINAALATADMAEVAAQAEKLGKVMARDVPPTLMQQLPEAFRKQGFAVHDAFDQLALDARDMPDQGNTLKQLGDILGRCVTCHETYQLQTETPGTK